MTLNNRLNLGQPTKILNYVKVFQHMMFNDSVVQCVQFVSTLDFQLCDQLEEGNFSYLRFFQEFVGHLCRQVGSIVPCRGNHF